MNTWWKWLAIKRAHQNLINSKSSFFSRKVLIAHLKMGPKEATFLFFFSGTKHPPQPLVPHLLLFPKAKITEGPNPRGVPVLPIRWIMSKNQRDNGRWRMILMVPTQPIPMQTRTAHVAPILLGSNSQVFTHSTVPHRLASDCCYLISAPLAASNLADFHNRRSL